MARASTWTTETNEKANYTKLSRLLYDGGSDAVRFVFDGICPPASLAATLKTNEPILRKLKKPKGRVLNDDQWDKLYPPNGASPDSKDFDITLLFVLLRNICGLTKPTKGWDALPPGPTTDPSLEANLARIKFYRNNAVAHSAKAEIDDFHFETYWKWISAALVSLGLKQNDIDYLKSSPLGADNYNLLLQDWYNADKDINSKLERIGEDASQTRVTTEKIMSGITEIKDKLPPNQREIDKLAHRDFRPSISELNKSYHPGTRKWVLDDVKKHVAAEGMSNVVVIQAGPGMGKSAVAAKLCQVYEQEGILGGCHFFKHNNSLRNNPRLMFQSVARQLCGSLPAAYGAALEKQLKTDLGKNISDLNCTELFTVLFEEPCSKLTPENHFVVVIDALDECCNRLKEEFFQVLRDKLTHLPAWLRFVLTTRPPPSISSLMIDTTIKMDPGASHNTRDLFTYFDDKLKELGPSDLQIERFVDITEGLFLIAWFIVDYVRNTKSDSLSEALEYFPKGKGITSVYENYFSRLKEVLMPYIKHMEGFYDMLDAVVAAKSPIEKNIFYDIIGLSDEPRIPNRERKEAINLLHQLFPVENDHVSAFHKTVIDWLTSGDHDFRVKGDGIGVLANACYDVLTHLKEDMDPKSGLPNLTDSNQYALSFGFEYMQKSTNFSEQKKIEVYIDPHVLCLEAFFGEWINDDVKFREYLSTLPSAFENIYRDLLFFSKAFKLNFSDWYKYPTFDKCLDFTFQAVNLLTIDDKERSLHYLKENYLPFHERETLLEKEKLTSDEFWVQGTNILSCKNGVLLVQCSEQQTLVQKYHLNGELDNEMTFSGHKKIYTSPDSKLIVVTPIKRILGQIEIVDVATFAKHNSYKTPNVIRSCHLFGSEPWYIVVRCFNNKIYVMEGETGKLVGHPTALQQNDDVMAVSKTGQILLARKSYTAHSSRIDEECFTDDEGYFCEPMKWTVGEVNEHEDNKGLTIAFPVKRANPYLFITVRELFLSNHKKLEEKIPILARSRNYPWKVFERPKDMTVQHLERYGQPTCFSDNGNLLAFNYAWCITIVNTSDGSLYKSIFLPAYPIGSAPEILFLSNTRIVLHDINGRQNIFSFKFGEDAQDVTLENIYFLPKDAHIHLIVSRANESDVEVLIAMRIKEDSIKEPTDERGSYTVKVTHYRRRIIETYTFHQTPKNEL